MIVIFLKKTLLAMRNVSNFLIFENLFGKLLVT